jgi:NAD(P)-dependent dehydrogenase (short-subunit alcohol dehydrogenase family)
VGSLVCASPHDSTKEEAARWKGILVQEHVVVVIGVGGMGEAIARQQGLGRHLLLADFNVEAMDAVATRLETDGYRVATVQVDVSDRESVRALAHSAISRGPVVQVVHTAGLSPVQAGVEAILRVDLYGVAVVLAEFGEVIAPYGTGVVIASMAGHVLGSLASDQEAALMGAPLDDLLCLPFLQPEVIADPAHAYMVAKRANVLRVMQESLSWGRRNARVNSISPGIIATPMGRDELEGENGAGMRSLMEASGTGRVGTSTDIAKATAFLLGPDSSFVTGTDLLVDGGALAALRAGG